MTKRRFRVKKNLSIFTGLIGMIIFLLTACEKEDIVVLDAFNNDSESRNLIVVISDLHLGADISYAEINANLDTLRDFLEQIRVSRSVKELVIAGDLLDEWFVPASVDTYDGKDQSDFVNRIAVTNKEVIDKFNQIIQEGNILVTYIPGNHDLTITEENVDRIFPGINQARDAKGLGTYSPAGFPKIAIEHGHRYNFVCSPDPISNQDIAPGTILPPGYFFTRLAAQHVAQHCTQNVDVIHPVTPNSTGDESQAILFNYWGIWYWWLNMFPIEDHFNEKTIVTKIDGFSEALSVNDLIPYQTTPGGEIKVNLFSGIQDTWTHRCEINNVPLPISVPDALNYAASATGTDTMAVIQYFSNPASYKRLVVFGHSHSAKIKAYENYRGEKAIYANSGTWIDDNLNGSSTMNFVIITLQSKNDNSQTYVAIYNFRNEVVTEMAKDSLRL